MAMMQAVHIDEFVKSLDELKVTTIPIPKPPTRMKEPHYLIKITHTSPTHVDTLYARGLHQNNHPKKGHVHPPFTLGTEFSGVVVKVYHPVPSTTNTTTTATTTTSTSSQSKHNSPSLRQIKPLTPGTKVWGMTLGTFATYTIATHSAIRALPPGLSLLHAAGLGASTAPVSYGALTRIAKLRAGETILIHAAASGLGVAAVKIALKQGANVIATVGSGEKEAAIYEILLNHHRQRHHTSSPSLTPMEGRPNLPARNGVIRYDTTPNWHEKVLELTHKTGVDVVFDSVGLVTQSIKCCAFNARVVIIGFVGRGRGRGPSSSSSSSSSQPKSKSKSESGLEMESVPTNRILLKQIQLFGYRFGESSRRDPVGAEEVWRDFEAFLGRDGGTGTRIGVEPVVWRVYDGLRGVGDALGALGRREVIGKVVVKVSDDDDDDDDEEGKGKGKDDGGRVESKL